MTEEETRVGLFLTGRDHKRSDLLVCFAPVGEETLEAQVCQGMMERLLEDGERNCRDIGAYFGGADQMRCATDGCYQHFGWVIVVRQDLHHILDQREAVLADVVEASDER